MSNVIRATIFNGPYSECNNPNEYNDLSTTEKDILFSWIKRRLSPHEIKSYNPNLSSYGLKHIFERETGLYVKNGQFKGAMLTAEHTPKDKNRINWIFKIGQKAKVI